MDPILYNKSHVCLVLKKNYIVTYFADDGEDGGCINESIIAKTIHGSKNKRSKYEQIDENDTICREDIFCFDETEPGY